MILKIENESSDQPVVIPSPDADAIRRAILEVDWTAGVFMSVVLEHDDKNYADVSGNLSDMGLSHSVRAGHVQHIGVSPPKDLEAVTSFLTAYNSGDLETVYEILFEKPMSRAEIESMNSEISRKTEKEQLGIALGCLAILFAITLFAIMAYLFPGGL